MSVEVYDAVVIGAGTAGANAAYQLARQGRRVALVERRVADQGGAQWHNGLLDRHFDEARLDRPIGAERVAANARVHMRSASPSVGATVPVSPTVTVDMGLLGRRLRSLAVEAGVEVIDRVRRFEVGLDAEAGRIRSVTLHRTQAETSGATPGTELNLRLNAALFVDASGRRGVLRQQSPALAPWCAPVAVDELCSAADVQLRVHDRAGALRFLDRCGAAPGDAVCFIGLAGGFSTCAVTVSADLETIGVVVGCLANGRYSTGPRMVTALREREPWIGEPIHAGAGVIPLRRPYARFTAPGVAVVGDAACQVFPGHGSGVGLGLIAGTMLADAVVDADDPGDADLLWRGYQAPFHRRYGGMLAAYDSVRRVSTAIGERGVDAMVRGGLVNEFSARTSLDQEWMVPPTSEALHAVGRFVRHPGLARTVAPGLARAEALYRHADRYPLEPSVDDLRTWEQRSERLLGPLPR